LFVRTAAAWIVAAVLFYVPAKASVIVSARSAVLMDATTGRILWEKQAQEQSLIASTTKIMTGLLIAEDCDLNAEARIPKAAVGIEGSSLYLIESEVLTVEALLYGMMLRSGNDAATALAIHHSGSVKSFVETMNRKARLLGLTNTSYANPHGLDSEGNYSTALDLAKLTAYAMDDPVFYKVVSTQSIRFGAREFTNHNKLLWQYDGTVGVKTGYTRSAGRILVSCAERDGRRLIAVTISAPDDWNDHKKLLDYGFSNYFDRETVSVGQVCGFVPVVGGVKREIQATASAGFSYTVTDEEVLRVCYMLPKFVYAPVLAGEQAGMAIVYLNEKEIGRVPLIWRDTVMEEA